MEKVYCKVCKQKVDWHLTEAREILYENETDDRYAPLFDPMPEYVRLHAWCDICGTELRVPKVEDANSDRRILTVLIERGLVTLARN